MAYQAVVDGDSPNSGQDKWNANDLELYQTKLTASDLVDNYVVSGFLPSVPGASLSVDTPAGAAYVGTGIRVEKLADPHTYTISKDTYVDLLSTGAFSYTEVANGAGAPSLASGALRLFKVVTNATVITGITDLRDLNPTVRGATGVTDHGALTGLADDDHTQYQLRSEKDQNSGYAGLSAGGLVPISRIATGTPDGTKFVRDDGTLAVPSGGGSGYRTLVTLGSDVVNNNAVANTLQDVTGLSFPVVSGTTRRFFALIVFDTQNTANGSRWTINGPGTPTICAASARVFNGVQTVTYWAISAFDGGGTSHSGTHPSATNNICVIEGIVNTNASGNVIVRFASETASFSITAKAGSTVEYW